MGRGRRPGVERFSWAKALLWLGGVESAYFGIVLVLGASGATSGEFETLGRRAAPIFVMALPVGVLLASYTWQLDGRRAGMKAGALVALVVSAWTTAIVVSIRASAAQKAAARSIERRPVELSLDGRRWIRHPFLGFELHHPGEAFRTGGLNTFDALQLPIALQRTTWTWADDREARVLLLVAASGPGASRERFEAFWSSLTGPLAPIDGHLDWTTRTATLKQEVQGLAVELHLWGRRRDDVVVAALTARPAGAAPVPLEGFRWK